MGVIVFPADGSLIEVVEAAGLERIDDLPALVVFPALADAKIDPLFQIQPLNFIESPAQMADVADTESGQRANHLHLHD